MAAKSEKWKGVKTRNLSAKQQEQAKRIVGGGRTEKVKADELKAARGTTLDINQTKWMTAKDRGGAGRGGLLTDASGKALTGTVKLPSGKTATYVRGKRLGVAGGQAPSSARGQKPTPAKPTPAKPTPAKPKPDKPTPVGKQQMSAGKLAQLKSMEQTQGSRVPEKPKAGDKYTRIVNGRPTPMVWTGSRWMLATSY